MEIITLFRTMFDYILLVIKASSKLLIKFIISIKLQVFFSLISISTVVPSISSVSCKTIIKSLVSALSLQSRSLTIDAFGAEYISALVLSSSTINYRSNTASS